MGKVWLWLGAIAFFLTCIGAIVASSMLLVEGGSSTVGGSIVGISSLFLIGSFYFFKVVSGAPDPDTCGPVRAQTVVQAQIQPQVPMQMPMQPAPPLMPGFPGPGPGLILGQQGPAFPPMQNMGPPMQPGFGPINPADPNIVAMASQALPSKP